MIAAEIARKQLYKASILKADDLPRTVVDILVDELDSDEDYTFYEIENMVSSMLIESGVEYKYLYAPAKFEETLNNILVDFNYSVEGIYSFPGLFKYRNHPLFIKVMNHIEQVYYPNNSGGGNLIEFVHLATSSFAKSNEEHERQFALQDPTAFLLAIQNNGGINVEEVIQFLSILNESINYIAELTIT